MILSAIQCQMYETFPWHGIKTAEQRLFEVKFVERYSNVIFHAYPSIINQYQPHHPVTHL